MYMSTPQSSPELRRWTNAAKECLKRSCVCDGCYYKSFFDGTKYKCDMKRSVILLVQKFGYPQGMKEPSILEEEKV